MAMSILRHLHLEAGDVEVGEHAILEIAGIVERELGSEISLR